jgi:uroporphyrin-III C-methyltransferase/precorrin-2 dehydrogenase/sirohydrochlorin ferrochelatase
MSDTPAATPNGSPTSILNAIASGSVPTDADPLVRRIYDELRRLAHGKLSNESVQRFQTTDLVHEAYVKLFRAAGDGWQTVLKGVPAEHVYAGRNELAEQSFEDALAAWRDDPRTPEAQGEAYLVGAGPGAPDLITVRGRQLLAEADVVLYDRLANPKLLEYARRDAELICVAKTPRKPSITQPQLNRLLVRLVASGKRVCRLKGGDPMVFGRGGEEMEALTEAGLRFQVVPGVSAVEGCAAYAGIPLTLRGVAKAVLIATGFTRDGDNSHLAAARPGLTLALYMGVAQLDTIGELLIANGHKASTPAAVVENGTTEQQRVIVTTVGELAGLREAWQLASPALLLVGETVRYAQRYSWFNPSGLAAAHGNDKHSLARVS